MQRANFNLRSPATISVATIPNSLTNNDNLTYSRVLTKA